jgi:cytochrome c oxidase subunit II
VGKGWSVLFGVVMAACGGLFFVAPFIPNWWLPEGVSTHAGSVDGLFYFILAVTGFFFILTEALLVYFMWVYAARPEGQEHVFGHGAQEKKVFWTTLFKRLFRPVSAVLHDQHRVELAWTLVPAVILLYIAFAQVNAWAEVKYLSRLQKIEEEGKAILHVEVSARQFEWRMRYPSLKRFQSWKEKPDLAKDFAKNPHADDVHVTNELHVWTNSKPADPTDPKQFPAFVAHVRTVDVLHSFNIPVMRVKQDTLPGKIIPVWFRPTKSNTTFNKAKNRWEDGGGVDAKGNPRDPDKVWEIACAELCGWGHFRMLGRVYVHPSEADFVLWLKSAEEKNRSTKREAAR